jgi:hypothetical protein
MNKKGISTLVIVAIVVIAVVVVGIGVYWMYYGGGGEPEPTPTPSPTPNIQGATSISFDVEATVDDVTENIKFTAKNLGTSDVLLRVDETDAQGTQFVYLMNQTAQTAWAKFSGQWMDVSSDFSTIYWSSDFIGYTAVENHMDALVDGWTGTGDYEYTSNGDSFVISNVSIDPSLPDSIFQTD